MSLAKQPSVRILLSAGLLAWAGSSSYAFDTLFTLQAGSSMQVQMSTATPLAGTFIGDYDAVANPTGTKTLPGLFGGSTNTPIPYAATVGAVIGVDTPTTGTFHVIDGFAGLVVDLLAISNASASPGGADLTLTINYSSFHTVNPTGLFPGGIDIPLPLGTVEVQSISMAQTSPTPAIIAPDGLGGLSFSSAVPVEVTVVASSAGAPVDIAPFPAVLAINGSWTETATGPVIEGSGSQADSTIVPANGATITDQPMDIPTVLPAGGTAHLLMSGVIADTTVDSTVGATLIAHGESAEVPGDTDGDGDVDGGDLAYLLGAWGLNDPAADFDGSGVVDAQDLAALLGNWD